MFAVRMPRVLLREAHFVLRRDRGGPAGDGAPAGRGGGVVGGAGEEEGEEAGEGRAEHGGAGADDADVDFEAGPEGCGGLVVWRGGKGISGDGGEGGDDTAYRCNLWRL